MFQPLASCALILALATPTPGQEPPGPLPNILVILADDLGYGDLGCYNPESRVPTPHLDRLAREGLRFTDAHSPSTVCTPTRYSLLTGRMAFRLDYRGVFSGAGGPCLIEEGRPTVADLLRTRGYATALMGKWHVGLTFFDHQGRPILQNGKKGVERIDYSRPCPDAPIHRGFDEFFGTACCPTTDWLYAYIEGDRIPRPPTKLLDRGPLPRHPYSRDNRPGWIAPDFDLEKVDLVFLRKSIDFLERQARSEPRRPFFLLHSMQAVHLPSFAAPEFQGKTEAGPHGDFIFEMDAIVGQLMATLERLGMSENTLVIFTSDNGPETTTTVHMRADHGHDPARPFRGMKRDQWEGGHRVPFIVRWPGKVPAGKTSDALLSLTDLLATLAAVAGAEVPGNAGEDSFDQLPVFLDPEGTPSVREYLLTQTISLALSIRRGSWKYLAHRGSGGNDYSRAALRKFVLPEKAPGAPGQLYDLEADPGETRNLHDERPELVRELAAKLEEFRARGRSAPLRGAEEEKKSEKGVGEGESD